MASSTSFKQQCPSCEAMVPIRDPGLIGRKIDCPKCKYRFVVEEPAVEEDDAPAPKKGDVKNGKAKAATGPAAKAPLKRRSADDSEEDDRPAKKKQAGGGSNMLIIGGVLAAVAVVAIGVGIFAFLGGDGAKTPPSSSGTGGTASTGGTETQPTTAPPEGEKPVVAATVYANASNLLPNESQVVISYPLSVSFGSALKAAGIDEAEGGFKADRFREQFGFGPDEVHRLITAMNNKEKWIFTVVQTKKPFKKDHLAKNLRLAAQTPVKSKKNATHEVFVVQSDFDGLGNMLVKFNQPHERLQLHFYDNNTLVFADAGPMKKFLENDRSPEHLTKDAPPGTTEGNSGGAGVLGGSPEGGIGPATPNAGGGPPRPGAGGGGAPSYGPPTAGGGISPAMPTGGGPMMGGMGMVGGAPGAQGATPTEAAPVGSWLTVDPSLKQLLDRVEKLEESKITRKKEPVSIITIAEMKVGDPGPLVTAIELQGKQERPIAPAFATKAMVNLVKKAKALAASLVAFDQKYATIAFAMEYRDNRETLAEEKLLRPILPLLLPIIKEGLGLDVKIAGGQANPQGGPGMGMGGMMGMMMGSRPGGIGEGTMGAMRPGMGSSPPPTGGGSGTGGPGGRFGGGRGEVGEGAAGAGGFSPGGTGEGSGTGGTEEKNDGHISLRMETTTLVFQMELHLSNEAYETLIVPAKEGMQWLKAHSELSATGTRYHELAKALKAYFDEKGHFPPGAMPRSPSAERGLPWRPDQRLSWAAALLPYFGEDIREWQLKTDESWNEGKNLLVAGRIVPALVVPRNTETGPSVISYPTVKNKTVAATHFVGISGLGLDAAEYKDGDEATQKKLGLFGYDRITKKADVKDQLKNTIAFLMVKGEHKAPWLAGGGATLRSVSDEPENTRPVESFICCYYPAKAGDPTKYDGKRGTIAVMADGMVRFIPEDISAEMFRALCTIAGGEDIERLDSTCPVIDEPEKRELKTTVPIASLTKPADGESKLTWKEYTPASKSFTAKFPGEVSEITQEVTAPVVGKLTVNVYAAKVGEGNSGCMVKFLELPAAPPDAEAFLQQQSAQVTNALSALAAGAKLKEEKKVTLGTNPGREWTFELPEKGIAKTRVYVVGTKVFEVTAGPSSSVSEADMNTFFDSFKVGS